MRGFGNADKSNKSTRANSELATTPPPAVDDREPTEVTELSPSDTSIASVDDDPYADVPCTD